MVTDIAGLGHTDTESSDWRSLERRRGRRAQAWIRMKLLIKRVETCKNADCIFQNHAMSWIFHILPRGQQTSRGCSLMYVLFSSSWSCFVRFLRPSSVVIQNWEVMLTGGGRRTGPSAVWAG